MKRKPVAPQIPAEGRHIAYDRSTGDYACHYDAVLIGFASSYFDAEEKLNAHVYDLVQHGQVLVGELVEEVV